MRSYNFMDDRVIIVGAGIIGSATAYHLKRMTPSLDVLLLDKNKQVGRGNTAKSAALYRNIFTSSISRKLASNSIEFYKTIPEQVRMRQLGYLWLFSENQWDLKEKIINSLDKENFDINILSKEEILSKIKINTEKECFFKGIHKGLLGKNCGSLSATSLAKFYASEFKKIGGKIKLGAEIKSIALSTRKDSFPSWKPTKIEFLLDQMDNEYYANRYLFALGAWTHNLLAKIGIFSGVLPKKRQLFGLSINPSDFLKFVEFSPVIILPTGGVYIKPVLNKDTIIIGGANDLGNPYGMEETPQTDNEYFFNALEPVLKHYFPSLKYKLFTGWSGYYSYHIPDGNPVIENESNIFWTSGTSGSGIMKADSIGRIFAGKILGLEKVELFSGESFLTNDLSLKHRKIVREDLII